jgi:polysaccharide biosynthesis/export protein
MTFHATRTSLSFRQLRGTGRQVTARCRAVLAAGALAVLLSGCASFPSSGPTVGRIEKAAKSPANQLGYRIVGISPETLPSEQSDSMEQSILGALGTVTTREPNDAIRVGDTLAISIFEVGITLFGVPGAGATAPSFPTANAQSITVQVDESGRVVLPYVGSFDATGRSTLELAGLIEGRLRQHSQSPQVNVAIAETLENTAYVSGTVARPGRYRLTSARERLLDLIALAGGSSINIDDSELRLVRGEKVATIRLGDLRPEDLGNIVVAPGDRIEILKQPKTYTVFGATDRISQVAFDGRKLSLAEAIARVGGPSDQRADPTGVFLFRFEKAGAGKEGQPIIYRLDLMNPASYFLAQRFAVRDKDVIYFANAEINPPTKFISLLNQLFSPVVTTRLLTK